MNTKRKYQAGDLFVKTRGKTSIQYISHIRHCKGDYLVITLCDMSDKTERTYYDSDIDTWHFYQHYPVKV